MGYTWIYFIYIQLFNSSHFLEGAFELYVCEKTASTLLQVLNGQYMKNRYIEVFHHVEVETSGGFGDVSKYLVT